MTTASASMPGLIGLIPQLPPCDGPGQDGGSASIAPRYEDITQDARIQLTALMPGLGAAVWRALLSEIPAIETFRSQGIFPILSRLVIACEDRPVSVNVPIRYEGAFRFAREKGGDRIFANMWLTATAPIATTIGPPPAKDAPYELVGRVFAEHVVTRPFAPKDQRRVTRLDAPGVPPVPLHEHVFEGADALIARAPSPLEDLSDTVFAVMHTDSNHHVNSLVYPRVFEEACTRKMMQDARIAQGAPEGAPPGAAAPQLLSRAAELRWRRPFFAGERARIAARFAPAEGAKMAAIGAFHGDGPKPSCAIQMWFR